MLGGAHGAGIDVEIGVQLAQTNAVTAGLQQSSECRGRNSFAKRGNHAASDEYISRHGLHRIPFRN
ncbi:unnamed protein product [Ciceribacter sp. T2.26MG-112.2]|nr:unnamed protein product [Ciceribacter naphthalenivorans]